MENQNENQVISEIIRTLPTDYYATEQSKNYYRQYDGCDDFLISDKLIEEIWEFFNQKILNLSDLGNKDIPATVSVLHTNSGAGRILEKAPRNTTLFAFNIDYVCKRITDILCQDKSQKGEYFSNIRDISQYFIARETNNSRKYDIVITQPMPDMTFYRGVECDEELSKSDPLEYYTNRSLNFVEDNGFLVVIYQPNQSEEIRSIVKNLNLKIHHIVKLEDLEHIGYESIILSKK